MTYADVNGRYHRVALIVFMVIVIAHWAEHLAQAIQVYVLGMPLPESRGVLGEPFPWLVTSEWMHYGYALIMLAGLLLLRPGFTGRARTWWTIALLIQAWHHVEHLLLLVQALAGNNFFDRPAPTSLLQLLVPRLELHLFYNAIVTIPMIVAVVLHRRAGEHERADMRCGCAVTPERERVH
jgi:hypothetical protein